MVKGRMLPEALSILSELTHSGPAVATQRNAADVAPLAKIRSPWLTPCH